MTKRSHSGTILINLIGCALFVYGVIMSLGIGGNYSGLVLAFALLSLATGIVYLIYASMGGASSQMDWPMVQGLMDILLALALFMSVNTASYQLLLYIFAIWSFTGGAVRLYSALHIKNAFARANALINSGACLLSAVLFLLGGLILYQWLSIFVITGVSLCVFAFGSFKYRKKMARH